MRSDDFPDVARVVTQSRIAQAIARVAASLRSAARTSAAAGLLARMCRCVAGMSATERTRMAGILLVTALVSHLLLLRSVSPLVRPAVPRLLYAELIAAAVVLILTAPQIVVAWPRSRVRRFFVTRSAAP